MRKMGRALAVALVFLLLASSFFAISFSVNGYDTEKPVGDTRQEDDSLILRVAMQDDIKSLNPLVGGDVWTWDVIQWIYDTPVKLNDDDEPLPYIAVGSANESTSQSPNWNDLSVGNFGYSPMNTWANSSKPEAVIYFDFTNVTWHDGTQMTIRDVLFSYHVMAQLPDWVGSVKCLMDKGGNAGSTFQDTHALAIEPVYESADGLQAALKFTLQEHYGDFFTNTLGAFLLPYHIWGSTISGQSTDNTLIWLDNGYTPDHPDAWSANKATAWENPEPIGSGPMKLDSWQKGVTIKIVTNRDHFYKSGYKYDSVDPLTGKNYAGQPTIEAIVFKIYKTAEQAVRALKNNEIDYIAWSIPPTFVQDLVNEPEIGMKQATEMGFFYLAYNMRLPSFGYNSTGHDVGKPFRKAIDHCIDKQRIIQRLLMNFGLAGNGPLPSTSEWYNHSLPGYSFDPQEAINILTEAGYQLTDPSLPPGNGNWWLNPDGSPIGSSDGGKIEILTPPADYDPIRAQAGLMIATQLQEIGINAESIAYFIGDMYSRLETRDFDMCIPAWMIFYDPVDYFYATSHSDNAATGRNYPGYQNESFDALIDLAKSTEDDSIREKAVKEAQAAIAYDLPYDVLYFRTNIEAYRSDRFTGWVTGNSGSIYNYDSIKNLRPVEGKSLNVQFQNLVSAIRSEDSVDVEVLVTVRQMMSDGTMTRTPAPNAYVNLSVSKGSLAGSSGITNENGIFRTTYTAPYIPGEGLPGYSSDNQNGTNVLMSVDYASLDGYNDASGKTTLLTIYPNDVPFLNVQMDADPDVIEDMDDAQNPGITKITVTVIDQDGQPVEGATTNALVDPNEPALTVNSSTDANGKVTFTFTSVDIYNDKEYRVSVLAQKDGYKNGSQSVSIYVIDHIFAEMDPPPPPPPFYITPLFIVGVITIVAIIVGLAILIYRKPKS